MSEPKTVTISLDDLGVGDWSTAFSILNNIHSETNSGLVGEIAAQIEAQAKLDTFGYSAVIVDTKGRIWQNQRHGTHYTHCTPWYCLDDEVYGEFSDFTVAEVLFEGVHFERLVTTTEEEW